MKFSTKARYGLRAMLDLAMHSGEGMILLKDVARRQEISERYLENIMRVLIANGLVNSAQGRSGGFALAKPAEQIQLNEIIETLDGSMSPAPCVDNPKLCNRTAICVTRDIWEKLKKAMDDVLNSITLQELVEMQKDKFAKQEMQMYFI